MHAPTDKLIIFDTTLRDGEQSPGVSLSVREKLEIARLLARMGVDVIEAGFPVTSPGDFAAVAEIARSVQGPIIAALARTTAGDIDAAWQTVREARRPRIHTFISTSPVHMEHMLKRTPAQVLRMAVEAVLLARAYTADVEFSAQDATRSDPGFLRELFTAVIEAGATTINVPDTVGYTTPAEFRRLLEGLRADVPNLAQATLSVHCHDDLGLATANSLAALEAGARQVECTINGIGERAGNTALEEVVMAVKTRPDHFGLATGIDTTCIHRASRLVASLSGLRVQPNKAVVGANAFAHEAGIHQDGVLKERSTYEIMRPEDVGLVGGRLVLGKHSGRHAFRRHLAEAGYNLGDAELTRAFARFKELADRKGQLTDDDILALVEEEILPAPDLFKLQDFQVTSGNLVISTATVRLARNGQELSEAAVGEGPVDALYKAIDRAVGKAHRLLNYSLQAVTGGKDALGVVSVRVEDGCGAHSGRGVSLDILEASARAYLAAVNKSLSASGAAAPAEGG
ncbi:MAG: 2-isopropylmalate synthase [Bacillota bacterium]